MTQTNLLEIMSNFVTEYNQNNPYIVKEAVTIINTLITFMDAHPDSVDK